MSYHHGKLIHYPTTDINEQNDLQRMCRSFYLDANDICKIATAIVNKEKILFMPNDVHEDNIYNSNTRKPEYVMYLFGVLEDGRSACVAIRNIKLFFDVEIPNENVERGIRECLAKSGTFPTSISTVIGKPLHYYCKDDRKYYRCFFDTKKDRSTAIDSLELAGYKTYWNDKSNYYRKYAREECLPLADWLIIDKYNTEPLKGAGIKVATLQVNDGDIRPYDESKGDKQYVKTESFSKERDKLMVCSWDSENYTKSREVETTNMEDHMYMICCNFGWRVCKDTFLKVCLTTYTDIPVGDDVFTITFRTPNELIQYFGVVVGNMCPDYMCGFLDSLFDAPYIHHRLMTCGAEHTFIDNISKIAQTKYNAYNIKYTDTTKIKLEAGTDLKWCGYRIPGLVCFDVCIEMRKLDPKVQTWSLNSFLAKCKLPLKEDVPYTEQFRIFREGTPEEKAKVRYYCTIDAESCHRLAYKNNFIIDKKTVANKTFLTTRDCMFLAGGVRVHNIMFSRAFAQNLVTSCEYKSDGIKGKYTGAWVIEPERGLFHVFDFMERYENGLPLSRPTPDLDFMSLYPSASMAYNIAHEKVVRTQEEYDYLTSQGEDLLPCQVEFDGVVTKYWLLRHGNDLNKMGVLPKALLGLMADRNTEKGRLKAYATKVEANATNPEYFNTQEGAEVEFMHSYHNTTQNAIKVLMNTFYGVCGKRGTPLFMLEVSNQITNKGREALNTVCDAMRKLNIRIIYGDTDSVYFQFPSEYFMELDKWYYDELKKYGRDTEEGRVATRTYVEEMIKISITASFKLMGEINALMEHISGGKYLIMQYEKCMFPLLTAMKKHYVGFVHMGREPSMRPLLEPGDNDLCRRNILVRGFKYDKRQASMFTNSTCFTILAESLGLYATTDIFNNIVAKFQQMRNMNIDYKTFIRKMKTSTKDASMVNNYIRRLEADRYPFREHPNYVGKVEYIYVKKPMQLTITGAYATQHAVYYMEQAELFDPVFLQNNPACKDYMQKHAPNGQTFEISLREYITKEMAGILGQFIMYRNEYKQYDDPKKGKEAAKAELIELASRILFDEVENTNVKQLYKKVKADVVGKGFGVMANVPEVKVLLTTFNQDKFLDARLTMFKNMVDKIDAFTKRVCTKDDYAARYKEIAKESGCVNETGAINHNKMFMELIGSKSAYRANLAKLRLQSDNAMRAFCASVDQLAQIYMNMQREIKQQMELNMLPQEAAYFKIVIDEEAPAAKVDNTVIVEFAKRYQMARSIYVNMYHEYLKQYYWGEYVKGLQQTATEMHADMFATLRNVGILSFKNLSDHISATSKGSGD